MILCARSTWRSSEQSTKLQSERERREREEREKKERREREERREKREREKREKERRDQVNTARNVGHAARTCEHFVYSIVKITRLHDYQTWPRHFLRDSQGVQRFVGFFS